MTNRAPTSISTHQNIITNPRISYSHPGAVARAPAARIHSRDRQEAPALASFAGLLKVFHGDGRPPRSALVARARPGAIECFAPPCVAHPSPHRKSQPPNTSRPHPSQASASRQQTSVGPRPARRSHARARPSRRSQAREVRHAPLEGDRRDSARPPLHPRDDGQLHLLGLAQQDERHLVRLLPAPRRPTGTACGREPRCRSARVLRGDASAWRQPALRVVRQPAPARPGADAPVECVALRVGPALRLLTGSCAARGVRPGQLGLRLGWAACGGAARAVGPHARAE